jgi:hypothetical protein
MDLTLWVTPCGIQTCLFENPLNSYLYIPPHLAHAPGILRGLVFGMTERIFWLTSHWLDQKNELQNSSNTSATVDILGLIWSHFCSHSGSHWKPANSWPLGRKVVLSTPAFPSQQPIIKNHSMTLLWAHAHASRWSTNWPPWKLRQRLPPNQPLDCHISPTKNLRTLLLFPQLYQAPADGRVSSFILNPAPAVQLWSCETSHMSLSLFYPSFW